MVRKVPKTGHEDVDRVDGIQNGLSAVSGTRIVPNLGLSALSSFLLYFSSTFGLNHMI